MFEAELKSENKMLSLDFEKAILAIGIIGNTENLGLEAIGVKMEKGHIVTDGFGATNI